MGLAPRGKYESDWVVRFDRELMTVLETARSRVESGTGDDAMLRWLGIVATPDNRTSLGKKLGKFRSNLNLRTIPVGFMNLRDRDAYQNACAWNIAAEQLDLGRDLVSPPDTDKFNTIELDENFNGLPDYLPLAVNGTVDATGYHQSKFETIAHELTHVLLGTKDVPLLNGNTAYGSQNAAILATQDASKAINNAENWAIFIESCGRNSSS